MRNISSIIASHNKSILRPKAGYGCNCRNKESRSLQNQCLTLKVIYEPTLANNSDYEKRVYFDASVHPLRSDIATIREILIMNVAGNVQSYRSTFGS